MSILYMHDGEGTTQQGNYKTWRVFCSMVSQKIIPDQFNAKLLYLFCQQSEEFRFPPHTCMEVRKSNSSAFAMLGHHAYGNTLCTFQVHVLEMLHASVVSST